MGCFQDRLTRSGIRRLQPRPSLKSLVQQASDGLNQSHGIQPGDTCPVKRGTLAWGPGWASESRHVYVA